MTPPFCVKVGSVAIRLCMVYNESINKRRRDEKQNGREQRSEAEEGVFSGKINRNLFLICLAIILICITIIAGMLVQTRKNKVESRTVAFGLRDIGELVTQAGYFTNVQKNNKDQKLFGVSVPFTTSQYIYSYDGIVKAGLDFSELEIQVDDANKIVTVTMPEVKIFDISIDNDSLKIYDESQSIFTPLHITDLNDAQIKLKEEVRQTAIDNGILEGAARNAKTLISGFLSGTLDLKDYTIEFEEQKGEGAQ